MTHFTEGTYAGEFLLSEAPGYRSRESDIVLSGEGVLEAGTVLGRDTASGKLAAYDAEAVDGTETAIAVLYREVDATSADAEAVIIARDAEVKAARLTGNDAAGTADLESAGIIVR